MATPETVVTATGGGGWGKLRGDPQPPAPTTTTGGSGWGRLRGDPQPQSIPEEIPKVGAVGGAWGNLVGDSQHQSSAEGRSVAEMAIDDTNIVKHQDSLDSVKGVKQRGEAPKRIDSLEAWARKSSSLDQSNEAILGTSFSEFKSEIKQEVSEVHSKISNMEGLLKNILQNMEK